MKGIQTVGGVLVGVAVGALAAATASAEVRLPAVLSDGVVLQRDMPVPIWGWASPGEEVSVLFAGQGHPTKADSQGRWRVELLPMDASGAEEDGRELVVEGEDNTVVVKDVLVGEVWVCSGQSNMEWPLSAAANGAEEVEAADYPRLRLLHVPRPRTGQVPDEPRQDTQARWVRCDPNHVGGFSAVGYFFGRELHRELEVPVGLIQAAYGGTPAEAWTRQAALRAHEATGSILERFEEARADFEQQLAEYEMSRQFAERYGGDGDVRIHEDPGNTGVFKGRADRGFEDEDWPTMTLPGAWESSGLEIDGAVWFRKRVQVPASWAGRDLRLTLGAIDDYDVTYFNGREVGQTGTEVPGAWATPRRYKVPGELVEAGEAVIAVRVFDHAGEGGFTGPQEQMKLEPAELEGLSDEAPQTIDLSGEWRYFIEHRLDPKPAQTRYPYGPGHPHRPGGLFNSMIAPILPHAVRGVIWYQGESNAARAEQYRVLFPALIKDWRSAWGQERLPFYFVQLANFLAPQTGTEDTPWAHLRDAQLHTYRTVPDTGMAVAIDIGEADDIHPRNKQDVGRRLARWALAELFDRDVVPSGPIYREMTVENGKVRIEFDLFGSTLKTRDDEAPRGFTIAGEDRRFVPAQAKIEGDAVMVWSDDVPEPVAVRYAWANNPVRANLVNAEGLPASPFRTDDWPRQGAQ